MEEYQEKVYDGVKWRVFWGGSLKRGIEIIQRGEEAVKFFPVEIGPEGAKELAAVLKENRTLKLLDLWGNRIGNAGADALAEVLKVNSSLTVLNLRGNDLNLESQVYLAACASFEIQDGIEYSDARVRAGQAYGIQARGLGIVPSRVPQEVLDRDFGNYAPKTIEYLEAMLFDPSEARQLKVLLVGPQQVGKTSLRRALKNKGRRADPTPENHAERATISVDIDEVEFKKGGKMSLWDFGGQEEYYMTHSFFLSNRSLVMVVVDLQAYYDKIGRFEECAGKWLRALQMQIFRPKVVIVGTKCDTQSKEQIRKKMASLQKHVDELGFKVRQAITEKTMGLPIEEQELQRLTTFEGLTFTEPRTFVVSGVDVSQGDGVAKLYDFLCELATNTGLGVALRIPKAFDDLRNIIERKRNEKTNTGEDAAPRVRRVFGRLRSLMERSRNKKSNTGKGTGPRLLKAFGDLRGLMERKRNEAASGSSEGHRKNFRKAKVVRGKLYLDGNEVADATAHLSKSWRGTVFLNGREVRRKKFQPEVLFENELHVGRLVQSLKDLQRESRLENSMFRLALGLLHDLGMILWYEKSEQLCDVVFSDPKWVVEIVRQVFRHDLFERHEGYNREGALYDLEDDGTMNLPALQNLLKDKCILDERLLRLFPLWRQMSTEMFDRCVKLLQQFELMYKIPQSEKDQSEPSQYMIPLFLRPGFVGPEGRKVQLGNPDVHKSLQKRSRTRLSRLSGAQALSTRQEYHFFAFLPVGLLFRVIARTFRIADFYKLSDTEAKAVYNHKSGVSVLVQLSVELANDGSGRLSFSCKCDKESDDAVQVVERTRRLFVREIDQLMEESFRLVPFALDIDPCLVRNETEKKKETARLRQGSLLVCDTASDYSYFLHKEKAVQRKFKNKDRYVVKKYCFEAIAQQLGNANRKTEHLVHVGKDIRGKLKNTFRLRISSLHNKDPLKKELRMFEKQFAKEPTFSLKDAERFLALVFRLLSRLRTKFDCFLAHKWDGGGHDAVVRLSQKLEGKGIRCWVDSGEMKRNIREMIAGIDNSHVFVACVTEPYLDAIRRQGGYCAEEFDHARLCKAKNDLVAMFLDEDLADSGTLQELPGFCTLFCVTSNHLFDRVVQELFPHDDDAASRLALLEMYPASSHN